MNTKCENCPYQDECENYYGCLLDILDEEEIQ